VFEDHHRCIEKCVEKQRVPALEFQRDKTQAGKHNKPQLDGVRASKNRASKKSKAPQEKRPYFGKYLLSQPNKSKGVALLIDQPR